MNRDVSVTSQSEIRRTPRRVRSRLIPGQAVPVIVLLLAGCAGPAEVLNRNESYRIEPPGAPRVSGILPRVDGEIGGHSRYALLKDGVDAFSARAILARQARYTIDAQYYFVREDLAGTLFKALLLDAANRGVRIRLLIDDMYLHGKEERLSFLAAHPAIEIRGFNAFYRGGCCRTLQFLTRFGDVTRRMHNKSFTVDNRATIVGGRNIGNEYFGADETLVFDDLDLLALGPVVDDVSAAFDAYWNHALAIPIEDLNLTDVDPALATAYQAELLASLQHPVDSDYISALAGSNFVREVKSGEIRTGVDRVSLIADWPDKLLLDRESSAEVFGAGLGSIIRAATNSVTIVSPYFVPTSEGARLLAELAEKGVNVRVITNSMASNNSAVVHAHYAKRRKALLRSGVSLYEVKPEFSIAPEESTASILNAPQIAQVLHTKAFTFDGDQVFIGSFNFDPRSLFENTEMGLLVDSPEFARGIDASIEQALDSETYRLQLEPRPGGGEMITWEISANGVIDQYRQEPGSGFWQRLWSRILGWLPVEAQL